jgi:hypothetical protein
MSTYKPHNVVVNKLSKAQLEQRTEIARRIMQHLEFDPDLFDIFSKKQKIQLLRMCLETPTMKSEKERTVPRHYIRVFRENFIYRMKNHDYDHSTCGLSLYDMATFGIPFCLYLSIMLKKGEFGEGPQKELAQKMHAKIEEKNFTDNDYFTWIYDQIHTDVGMLSQPNFRLYGYYFQWRNQKHPAAFERLRLTIYITSTESSHKHFEHNGTKRIAYLIRHVDDAVTIGHTERVERREIHPNGINGDFGFNLYIQSHALHRFKERLNAVSPQQRNVLLFLFLVDHRKVVQTAKGPMFACTFRGSLMGYFPFFIQGDDLVVSTFLPVVNNHTAEGKKFFDTFGFTKDDIAHIGMDKQQFYLQVDFNQIPALKQALQDAGLGHVKEHAVQFFLNIKEPTKVVIDQQRTQFVAGFFKKWEEWKRAEELKI